MPEESSPQKERKFVGIQFQCCQVYWRIYKTKDGTRYAGNCPKCGAPISIKIGPGGSDSRFFEA